MEDSSSLENLSTFKISLGTAIFEIAGSESFVDKQVDKHIEKFSDLIGQFISVAPTAINTIISATATPIINTTHNGNGMSLPPASSNGMLESYAHVYEMTSEGLKIICDIPGAGKRAQMRSVALLYLYGSDKNGLETVATNEIRNCCVQHGCLDKNNFAAAFKELKSDVVLTDKGKTARLTQIGKRHAEDLLKQVPLA